MVEGRDWSNDYATEWYDYDSSSTVFVEEHHEEANADMPETMEPVSTEPVLDADGFLVEEAPVEPAPVPPVEGDMAPEMAPEVAPEAPVAPQEGDETPPQV